MFSSCFSACICHSSSLFTLSSFSLSLVCCCFPGFAMKTIRNRFSSSSSSFDSFMSRRQSLLYCHHLICLDSSNRADPQKIQAMTQSINRIASILKVRLDLRKLQTDGCILFVFKSVSKAQKWVGRQVEQYPDSALMIGRKWDPLIRKYCWFRINTKLFHILQYIGEGKLEYDPITQKWVNWIQNIPAKECADEWLNLYKL